MNRLLAIALLLIPSLTFAQEAWTDDVPVIDAGDERKDSDTVLQLNLMKERLETLEKVVAINGESLGDVAAILKDVKDAIKLLAERPVSSAIPGQCECDCDCPTVDEIRDVVREELDRVTVTLKNDKGETKKVELSLTVPGKPAVKSLGVPADGNWYTTAINGEPCVPTYSHSGRQYYESESYDVGMMPSGDEWVGAARNKKCRMETLQDGRRVKVCN